MFLDKQNEKLFRKKLNEVIDKGLKFKNTENVKQKDISKVDASVFLEELQDTGLTAGDVSEAFEKKYLPYCYNFSSKKFMGFPDAGNSLEGLMGGVYSELLQQNLINQSFCSPSGTFMEINVIRWLREVVGYKNPAKVNDILDVGGIVTMGGTSSNTIGILLARENYKAGTMQKGVSGEKSYIIVPEGIGHYSVKSAQMWVGCGNNLIEVPVENFKYNLTELEKTLKKYKGRVMALVAYAGDSRTMTVDNFNSIHSLVKSIDPSIWLHADACHSFALGFSEELRYKIKGIELFDSITTDPHKTMNIPYTASALLVKDTKKLKTVSSISDLIMQEKYAFGQITPFIGSKPWMSLKLWFVFKALGKGGLNKLINERHSMALLLKKKIEKNEHLISLNNVDIHSVMFMYKRAGMTVEELNSLNKSLHKKILDDGVYHLHQFSVPDSGRLSRGKVIYPLRYMSGNPIVSEKDLDEMIDYVVKKGDELYGK